MRFRAINPDDMIVTKKNKALPEPGDPVDAKIQVLKFWPIGPFGPDIMWLLHHLHPTENPQNLKISSSVVSTGWAMPS